MKTWAVVASGPSLTEEDFAFLVRARQDGLIEGILGTNNVFLDFPCDIGVAHDSAWLNAYAKEVMNFKGAVYSRRKWRNRAIGLEIPMVCCNSGLLAMFCARDILKAEIIILLGFDLGKSNGKGHYFGDHSRKNGIVALKNTCEKKFAIHRSQFLKFSGCDVVNCSRITALEAFRKEGLEEAIRWEQEKY